MESPTAVKFNNESGKNSRNHNDKNSQLQNFFKNESDLSINLIFSIDIWLPLPKEMYFFGNELYFFQWQYQLVPIIRVYDEKQGWFNQK